MSFDDEWTKWKISTNKLFYVFIYTYFKKSSTKLSKCTISKTTIWDINIKLFFRREIDFYKTSYCQLWINIKTEIRESVLYPDFYFRRANIYLWKCKYLHALGGTSPRFYEKCVRFLDCGLRIIEKNMLHLRTTIGIGLEYFIKRMKSAGLILTVVWLDKWLNIKIRIFPFRSRLECLLRSTHSSVDPYGES
jgi:hypothetical protein